MPAAALFWALSTRLLGSGASYREEGPWGLHVLSVVSGSGLLAPSPCPKHVASSSISPVTSWYREQRLPLEEMAAERRTKDRGLGILGSRLCRPMSWGRRPRFLPTAGTQGARTGLVRFFQEKQRLWACMKSP